MAAFLEIVIGLSLIERIAKFVLRRVKRYKATTIRNEAKVGGVEHMAFKSRLKERRREIDP